MYEGTHKRLQADSSAETLQAKREWYNIFKMIKKKQKQQQQKNI